MCVSVSVLLGCSCCAAVDKTLEFVARGMASRLKTEKSQWAAGRVGDIDFIGPTKTKGKVRLDMEYTGRNAEILGKNHSDWCLYTQFVRVQSSTDPVLIYQMLTEEWGLAPPHLVVALVGGDELAQMKPWLRDTLRKGLVKAAQSTGEDPATKSDLGVSNQAQGIESLSSSGGCLGNNKLAIFLKLQKVLLPIRMPQAWGVWKTGI